MRRIVVQYSASLLGVARILGKLVDNIPQLAAAMAQEDEMPKILDKAVQRVQSRGVPAKSAWPIAVASLQKAGDIKKGHLTATQKGAKRGAMTRAQREASREK